MRPNPQIPVDLVTFAEEILNEKLHFFVRWKIKRSYYRIMEQLSKKLILFSIG